MPVTIDQIKKHLDALEVRHMPPGSQSAALRECGARFATHSYVDPSGDHTVLLVFSVDDDGQYLEVCAPMALNAAECRHKGALFTAMLHVALMTKHVQVEHDPSDGEIRFSVDVPVCDGVITTTQVSCMVFILISVLEEYYPVFRHAMETGKIDMGLAWMPEGPAPTDDERAAVQRELDALVERMGGIEKVEEALREMRARGGTT